jgi:hypothetical protein
MHAKASRATSENFKYRDIVFSSQSELCSMTRIPNNAGGVPNDPPSCIYLTGAFTVGYGGGGRPENRGIASGGEFQSKLVIFGQLHGLARGVWDLPDDSPFVPPLTGLPALAFFPHPSRGGLRFVAPSGLDEDWKMFVGRGFSHDINPAKSVRL